MTLTVEDIRGIVREEIQGLEQSVKKIEGEQFLIKGDITTIQGELSAVKGEIAAIKGDITIIKGEIAAIKQEQHRQGILQEEMHQNIRLLAEAISSLLKKSETMGELDGTLKLHNDQIKFTQSTLRDHIIDKKAHPSLTQKEEH